MALPWINVEKLDWYWLSYNPDAIHLLEQNQDKIDWYFLSRNENAIPLLEKNIERIDWDWVSCMPSAIELLKKHKDKVQWNWLSSNPFIMEYDYEGMKRERDSLLEELMRERFHPNHMDKFESWGF